VPTIAEQEHRLLDMRFTTPASAFSQLLSETADYRSPL
jgi:hypothetical protein